MPPPPLPPPPSRRPPACATRHQWAMQPGGATDCRLPKYRLPTAAQVHRRGRGHDRLQLRQRARRHRRVHAVPVDPYNHRHVGPLLIAIAPTLLYRFLTHNCHIVEHAHSPRLGPHTHHRLLAARSAAHGRLTHSCLAGARRFAQCFRGFQCILPQFARCWKLVQRSPQMGQMVYCPCLDEIELGGCSASEQAQVRQVLTGQVSHGLQLPSLWRKLLQL